MSARPPTISAPSALAPPRRPLAWTSDEQLAELARDGDERAFEVIVERYRSQLLAHARRVAGDRAEDALQLALVSAWHALRGRRDVRHVRAWLYKIVHRAALQTLRERREIPIELVDAAHPQAVSVEQEFERSMRARAALSALAALPLREREALVGTSVEGRSTNDVARDLGIADGALRQLVFRARMRARAAVGAFTPPLFVLRLRALARGWHRRAQAGVGHATASLPPISNPLAVGSAIVITAAGAQVAGVPLIPRGHRRAHEGSALLVPTGRAGSRARDGSIAISSAQPRAGRAPARASAPVPETSGALAGSQPRVRSAVTGARGSPAALPDSAGASARAQASAQHLARVLSSIPSVPSLPAAHIPTVDAPGDGHGAAARAVAAVAAVAAAAGEATRAVPQTVEHVVTTVVEPVAPASAASSSRSPATSTDAG